MRTRTRNFEMLRTRTRTRSVKTRTRYFKILWTRLATKELALGILKMAEFTTLAVGTRWEDYQGRSLKSIKIVKHHDHVRQTKSGKIFRVMFAINAVGYS